LCSLLILISITSFAMITRGFCAVLYNSETLNTNVRSNDKNNAFSFK